MSPQHNDLIQVCRYFKGESEYPDAFKGSDASLIWFYEKRWLESVIEKSKVLKLYLREYAMVGLTSFEAENMVPISLKALLFNRFAKEYNSMAGAVDDFKEWYHEVYEGSCLINK